MRSPKRSLILTLAIALGARAQQVDSGALGLLIQKLQTAYHSKDPDSVLALWSDKSPQRTAQREELKKILRPESTADVHESVGRQPEVQGGRARVRIDVQAGAVKTLFVLECVQENGEWKIWKQSTAADDLATRLASATTDKDQADLLAANEELIDTKLALAVIDRGRDARNHGDLQQALRIYQVAHTVAERAGAQQARALALNNTGLVYYDLGEFVEALRWYQRAQALSESLQDDAGTARALNNQAAIFTDSGELTASWDNLQRSLALGEKLHDPRLISNARGNMALIYGQRGDYAKSFSLLKESYDQHVKSDDKRLMSIDLLNLGNVLLWQGDYPQSEDYFQRAVTVSESGGLKPLTAIGLMSLGRVAEFRGELPDSIAKYQKSLAIFNEVGDKFFAASDLSFIGSAYSTLGDQQKAIEFFEKSLAIQKTMGAGSELALTLTRIAAAYNRNADFSQASKAAADALQLAESAGMREVIWRAHLEQGKADSGSGQAARAEGELAKAIATVEDLRLEVAGAESEKENFFEDKLEPYHRMIAVLAGAGRNAEAFEYAERAKARVLLDALKNGRTQMAIMMTGEERQREQDLRIKLGSLNARLVRGQQKLSPPQQAALAGDLNRARLEYASYETTLYAAHPQLRLQSGTMEPVTMAQAVQLMPGADAGFIEFVVTDDKVFTFVSAAESKVKIYVAPIARKELFQRVERFRQQLGARDLGFRASAASLYKLLLGPAGAELARTRHLIVVPDGVLWELPFQALVNPGGQYLLDRCDISYAPSLTALKAMREVKEQRKRGSGEVQLLAMGNPALSRKTEEHAKAVYRDQALGNLPQAETEVRELGRIYGEGQSHIYIGAAARESRFKAESSEANVLHLATHGIVNNASPLYSYLLLAGEGSDSSEDGLLEAWELLRMKLHAELVVLSACETARGRVGAGEGVIGLSWALFVSGVPATVLSEWKVESESTSRLMVAFHQNRKKGMHEAEALRAAELGIRKDPAYQHPFYWAPFIVIGAGM